MAVRQFVFPVDRDRPAWQEPSRRAVTLSVCAAIGSFLLALAMAAQAVSLAFVASGVFFALLAYATVLLTHSVTPRWVRVKDTRENITFVPARRLVVVNGLLHVTLLAVSLALAWAWLTTSGDAVSARRGYAALAVGPLLFLWFLWTLRGPHGLTLTPEGIRGVKFVKRIVLPWSAITDVSVAPAPGRWRVVIFSGYDTAANIDSAFIGSDAYAVRTVLRHFVVHPRDRERLAEGIGALELFGVEVEALERR